MHPRYDNLLFTQIPKAYHFRILYVIAGTILLISFLNIQQPNLFQEVWALESTQPADLLRIASTAKTKDSNKIGHKAIVVGKFHAVSPKYSERYQWIEPYSRKPFVEVWKQNGLNNNAMGRMPKGSPYDMLVVARGWSDKYTDLREGKDFFNLTIVGFFANYDPISEGWLRVGPEPYVLDLPVWRQYPRPCDWLRNGGPADPRFIWSDAGEPLGVIGTASRVSGHCKSVGLVDLRAVWPGLNQHLSDIGYGNIPINLRNFTEIGRADTDSKFEKNWAPFFAGPKPEHPSACWLPHPLCRKPQQTQPIWPLFVSRLVPHSILTINSSSEVEQQADYSRVIAEKMTPALSSRRCLQQALPRDWDMTRLHMATPFYRVTMCPRKTCTPTKENTVLLGLVHYKLTPKHYRRMFVALSTEIPHELISVSPPLHFDSVGIDDDVVFSISLAFLPTKPRSDLKRHDSPFERSADHPGGHLNHGWLDDTVVVGAGLRDESYGSFHIPMSTALENHTICLDRTR